jgi:replicative DNA helicase
MQGRQLPQAREAEEAVISAAMLAGRDAIDLAAGLRAREFFDPGNQEIWTSILDLDAEGTAPDVIALENKLKASGRIERVGGINRLLDLSAKVATAQFTSNHARIIREKAGLRNLIMLCGTTAAEAYGAEAPDALIGHLVTQAPECYALAEEGRTFEEVAKRLAAEVRARQLMTDEERAAAEARACIPTVIDELNQMLIFGGLPVGRITVVGARSSGAKSAFAKDLVRSNADRPLEKGKGGSSVVWSMEDRAESPVARMIAPISGIAAQDILRCDVLPKDTLDFHTAVSRYYNKKILFLERIPPSIEEFKSKTRRAVQRQGANLLIIDYLQLMRTGEKVWSRQQEVDACLDGVIELANSLPDTATVLVSQLKRTHEGRPTMEDLYHSAKIEQSAHTIILLYAPKALVEEYPDYKGIDVVKQKDGGIGLLVAGWDGPTISFKNPGHHAYSYLQALYGHKGG